MTEDCGVTPGDRHKCLAVPSGVNNLSDYTDYHKCVPTLRLPA